MGNVDFRKKVIEIGEAKYELIGKCRECGVGVYGRKSVASCDGAIGYRLACYFSDGTYTCRNCYGDGF